MSTANGNDIGSGGERSAGAQEDDDEMNWLPFFIGGGICLLCLCIVIVALIVRYRKRRERAGERLQTTGLEGTNMYDMDVSGGRESVKVDYLEPESTHELLPPLEPDLMMMSAQQPELLQEEPITEVHIEWVESERESERLPGYSALPAAASLRNGGPPM